MVFDWLEARREDMEKIHPGYGSKILIQLFLTYFLFCKALAYSLMSDSWFPIQFNINGLPGGEVNDLFVVVRAPWQMKPIWAVMSDVFPIMGYRKRFYILIAVATALTGLGMVAFTSTGPSATAFWLFLFVAGTTLCDSMSQARYTELMKAAGNASIVSFVWFLINLGNLLAFYNYLLPQIPACDFPQSECVDMCAWADGDCQAVPFPAWRWKILLYIAFPISLPMLVPASLNWLAEEQGPARCQMNMEVITKNCSIFVLSAVTAGVAIGGVVVQLLTDPITLFGITARWINGIYYGSGAILILAMCQICLPRNIALPAVYMFICKALFLNVGLIYQAWYIAPEQCMDDANPPFPYGPRFDLSYYQTVSGYGGALASLTGVVVFDMTIQYWNVRAAFWVTTAVNCLTTIFELMILQRWNQYALGFDPNSNHSPLVDQMFFILGAQAIDKLLDMLDSLPQTVLIGKLCPKNMEAQIFAILAALSNFGSSIAYVNAAIVAEILGVSFARDPATGSWSCSNPPGPLGINMAGWLKLLATFFLPLTTIPFTWCCLPNVRLCDDLLGEDTGDELMENPENQPPPKQASFDPYKSGQQDFWVATAKNSLISGGVSRDHIF